MEEFVESGSYLAIVLALLAGAVGVPIPEEVVLLTAGALAGRGVTRWWLSAIVCFFGVLLADTLLYFVARKLGNAALTHRRFRKILPPHRREKLRQLFQTRGPWVILVARHIPGVRAASFALAGIDRYPFLRFIGWDAIGLASSGTIVFSLGYFFAAQLDRARQWVANVQGGLFVLVVLVILFFVARAAWRRLAGQKAQGILGSVELRADVANPNAHEGGGNGAHQRTQDGADGAEEGDAAEDGQEDEEGMERGPRLGEERSDHVVHRAQDD